jgi:hypothetical protein
VEAGRAQHPFGVVGGLALFEQDESQAARSASSLGVGRFGESGLGPACVDRLEVRGESAEVATVDGWQVPANRDRGGARIGTSQVELLQPREGSHDRRVRALPLAHTERARRLGHPQFHAGRRVFKAGREMAQ